MEITKQDVEKVAKLARLDVSPTETEAFARQLSQILTHVEQLNRYSTDGVEPTSTVLGQVNVLDQTTNLAPPRENRKKSAVYLEAHFESQPSRQC